MSINNRVNVSIIIPVYNTDLILFERCVDSISEQVYEGYEVIVVDDGSRLEIAQGLDEICKKNHRIRIYHKMNEGVSVARNVGVRYAIGQYICFVDGDDYFSPYMLYKLVKTIENTRSDIVTSYIKPVYNDNFAFDRNTSFQYRELVNEEMHKYMGRVILAGLADDPTTLGYISGGPCSLIIKRELAVKHQFPEGIPLMEDVIWNYQVFNEAKKICIIEETLYAYRQNAASATHKWTLQMIDDRKRALELIGKQIRNYENEIQWFALRVLSNYGMICKCCALTDELKFMRERLCVSRQVFNDEVWNIIANRKVTKGWPTKQKIKRVMAKVGLLPFAYVIKSKIRR